MLTFLVILTAESTILVLNVARVSTSVEKNEWGMEGEVEGEVK
jgi:hypothetical protein